MSAASPTCARPPPLPASCRVSPDFFLLGTHLSCSPATSLPHSCVSPWRQLLHHAQSRVHRVGAELCVQSHVPRPMCTEWVQTCVHRVGTELCAQSRAQSLHSQPPLGPGGAHAPPGFGLQDPPLLSGSRGWRSLTGMQDAREAGGQGSCVPAGRWHAARGPATFLLLSNAGRVPGPPQPPHSTPAHFGDCGL